MSESVKILFAGDFCPHNRIETLAKNGEFSSIFNDFIDVFQNNDLNVVDMECPLTNVINRIPKTGPYQFASPINARILKHANIGLVAMANNHIMDCDKEGAKETLDHCKKIGIATVGIGLKEDVNKGVYSMDCKGKKIAIINFTENEFIQSKDATMSAGNFDLISNYHLIKNARKRHDIVILYLHGGNEFYHLPSPRIKATYRFFIDIGADAVISTHPHCFSGYEVYNGKPIFYSLGNFIYDSPEKRNKDWNKGFVVKLIINEKIDFEIIPLNQCNEHPGVFHLNATEKKSFEEKLDYLSSIIQDDVQLQHEFDQYCETVKKMYHSFIEPNFGKRIASLRARNLFPKLMGRKKKLLLLNIARCESHRDVLLNLLSKN